MGMRFRLAVGAVAVAALVSSAQADLVFEQNPMGNGGFVADAGGSLPLNRVADSFTLDSSQFVVAISFWGFYMDPIETPTDDFTLDIYADEDGVGSLLYTSALAGFEKVPTGGFVGPWMEWQYDANLVIPFQAAGGTTYWLSITNHTGNNDGTWLWEFGVGLDDSVQVSPDAGETWNVVSFSDVAVVLTGKPIPAPGACALLVLAGLRRVRRR